jgi:hypothetical protein
MINNILNRIINLSTDNRKKVYNLVILLDDNFKTPYKWSEMPIFLIKIILIYIDYLEEPQEDGFQRELDKI